MLSNPYRRRHPALKTNVGDATGRWAVSVGSGAGGGGRRRAAAMVRVGVAAPRAKKKLGYDARSWCPRKKNVAAKGKTRFSSSLSLSHSLMVMSRKKIRRAPSPVEAPVLTTGGD